MSEYLSSERYFTFLDSSQFFSFPPSKIFISVNILKLINALHDYYYSYFQAEFPIDDIEKIQHQIMDKFFMQGDELNEKDIKLLSKEYRVISYTYAKYYVISPFFVYPTTLNSMINVVDFDKEKRLKIKSFLETRIKEKKDNSYDELTLVLEPLLSNFRYFARHLDKIKTDCKGVFRSFEKIVLLPSVFMLYRILYFSESVTANMKYLTYETICLFLTCFHYFLQVILYEILPEDKGKGKKAGPVKQTPVAKKPPIQTLKSKEGLSRGQVKTEKVKKLKINCEETGEKSTMDAKRKEVRGRILGFFIIDGESEDIQVYLQNISDCIEIDLKQIKKEPLNIKLLLNKYSKYVVLLKKTAFLPKLENGEAIFLKFGKHLENDITDTPKEEKKSKESEETEFKEQIEKFLEMYQEAKKDLDNNILIDLFVNKKIDQGDFYNSILNDISEKCLEKAQKEYYYMEQYYSYFKSFNAIAISNPDLLQNYLLSRDNCTQIIEHITTQLKVLFQYMFIDFHKLTYKKIKPGLFSALENFTELIEFIRLLCENHNQRFQIKLVSQTKIDSISIINDKPEEMIESLQKSDNEEIKNIDPRASLKVDQSELISSEPVIQLKLIDFLLQILPLIQEHFDFYTNKSSFSKYFKISSYSYFEPLISKLTDFLIESIQGSKLRNFYLIEKKKNEKEVKKTYFCERYFSSAIKALDNYKNPTNRFFLSEFFRFIVSYLEENGADKAEKAEIIGLFNLNKILFFLIHCTKKLYKRIPDLKKYEEIYKIGKSEKGGYEKNEYHVILFKAYLTNPEYFGESRFFSIACLACKFLLLSKQFSKNTKITQILAEFQKEEADDGKNGNKSLDKFGNWKRQCAIFYGKIMKEIQVSQEFKYLYLKNEDDVELSEEDGKKSTITTIFFVNPDVLLLRDEDFEEFKNEAPYEDENQKLTYLIKYLPRFKEGIELKKSINMHEDAMFLFLSDLNYYLILQISAIISLFVNFFLILSALYVKTLSNTGEAQFITYGEKYSNIIFWVNLLHLIFLFGVCCVWFYFQIFYLKKAKKVQSIILHKLISKFLTGDTFLLFWNFFWGFIAILSSSLHFAYSLQLFSLFGLNETMTTVIVSVKMRYKQFLAAGLLMLIFSILFSSIKYIFFCDGISPECTRFLYAFLAMLTGGIRAGNGLNLEMKTINDQGYFWEFSIEWMFYFSIILIMLNVVNGIIVDTFQEQREKTNNRNDSKKNICYICNTQRTYFEKNGINYESHINVTHSLINYFQYMLTILKTDKQELNSLDFNILEQIQNNQTGFFPPEMNEDSDQAGKEDDDKEKENNDNDDEKEIEENLTDENSKSDID